VKTRRLTAGEIRTIAAAVDVSVPKDSSAVLIPRAITHYNRRLKPGLRPATLDSSQGFLARITVNYLRHVCSHYDEYRDQLRVLHPVDRDAVGALVKGRVLASIAKTHGWLAAACKEAALWDDRQASMRH
jgi:hypothetical protein